MIKQCIICGKEFVLVYRAYRQKCCSKECSLINKHRYRTSDIFKAKGRELANKYMKTYRKTKKYKDTHSRIGKIYKQTNKYKQWAKEYCQREDVKKRNKVIQNSNSYKQWRKEWCKGSVGKIICTRSRIKRRAMKNNYIESYTEKEWQDKIEATKGICPGINGLCLSNNPNVGIDKLTRDHFYPVSKANEDYLRTGIKRIYTIDDMQPLCRCCNGRKQDKIISNPKDLNTIETSN